LCWSVPRGPERFPSTPGLNIGAVRAVRRLRELPARVQFAGASAIALIVGTLTPWVDYGGDLSDLNFAAGIDLSAGEINLFVGVFVIFLLSRAVKQGRTRDAGAIAALGLLACGVMAVTAIRIEQGEYSAGWGIWVSCGGALALLVSGLILLDTGEQALPPPD
jgi:hypothetical protein